MEIPRIIRLFEGLVSPKQKSQLTSLRHSSYRTPYDAFRSRRYFGSLDGLRAIAILGVIWYHGPGQATKWHLLQSGREGVQLFFAISGFLITTLLLRERETTGAISLRNFYARRTLRIFPLYYTVLAIYMVVMFLARTTPAASVFFSNLPYFFTYTVNWFVSGGPFSHAWSLATEEQFYFVWPSCEKYLPQRWVIGLIAITIAVPLTLHAGWSLVWIPPGIFVRRLGQSIAPPICLGVLLAHLFHHRSAYERTFRWIGHPGSSLVSFIVAGAALQFRTPELVLPAALTLIVATCVVREDHWLAPVLSSRVLVHVGKVSYGAYLMHGLAYDAVGIVGRSILKPHGLIEFIAVTLFTIGLASFSFRFYESFFLAQKKRFEPLGSEAARVPLDAAFQPQQRA